MQMNKIKTFSYLRKPLLRGQINTWSKFHLADTIDFLLAGRTQTSEFV